MLLDKQGLRRSNTWHANGKYILKCPVDGCKHQAPIITHAHCRGVHSMERKQVKEKYGMPFVYVKKLVKGGNR